MNRAHKNVIVSAGLGLAAAAALLAFGCGQGSEDTQPSSANQQDTGVETASTLDDVLGGSNGTPKAGSPAGHGILLLPPSDGLDEYVAQFGTASTEADNDAGDSQAPASPSNPGGTDGSGYPGGSSNGINSGNGNQDGSSNRGAPATGGDSNDPANAPLPSGNSNSSSDGNDGSGGSGDTGTDKPAPAQSADSDMPEIIFPDEKPARDRFDLSWPGGSGSDNYPWPDLCELRGCVDVVEAPEPNAKPNATADTSDQAPKIWIKLPPLF